MGTLSAAYEIMIPEVVLALEFRQSQELSEKKSSRKSTKSSKETVSSLEVLETQEQEESDAILDKIQAYENLVYGMNDGFRELALSLSFFVNGMILEQGGSMNIKVCYSLIPLGMIFGLVAIQLWEPRIMMSKKKKSVQIHSLDLLKPNGKYSPEEERIKSQFGNSRVNLDLQEDDDEKECSLNQIHPL